MHKRLTSFSQQRAKAVLAFVTLHLSAWQNSYKCRFAAAAAALLGFGGGFLRTMIIQFPFSTHEIIAKITLQSTSGGKKLKYKVSSKVSPSASYLIEKIPVFKTKHLPHLWCVLACTFIKAVRKMLSEEGSSPFH